MQNKQTNARMATWRLFLPALGLIAAALAAGCTPKATLYQPLTDGQGYRDDAVSPNEYLVEFRANRQTLPAIVKNYTLYRCAELTREKKGDYFVLIRLAEAPYAPKGGKSEPGWIALIRVCAGAPTAGDTTHYDADHLLSTVSPPRPE